MSNQRTEIIIQEINYWKEHKLLPDVYCNFLLALYTKGENEIGSSVDDGGRRAGLKAIFQLIAQFCLLLLTVTILNMQHINQYFQVVFLVLSFIGILLLFKRLNNKRDIYFHLSTVILLVHLFFISVFLGNQYLNMQFSTMIIILCNFICWFVIGRKYRLSYLLIISSLLTIFTIIYTFL